MEDSKKNRFDNLGYGSQQKIVQQENDLLPTNRVNRELGMRNHKQKDDEFKSFENTMSPVKLKEQLL